MGYFLGRYTAAVRAHSWWLLLALVPPALYLAAAALTDVRYRVWQDLTPYAETLPVAASNSPVATEAIGELVAHPARLFLEPFALARLRDAPALLDTNVDLNSDAALRRLVHASMSLSTPEAEVLRLGYSGDDRDLGAALVGFYVERLLQRVSAGVARSRGGAAQAPGGPPGAAGDRTVAARITPWAADRWLPVVLLLVLSLLAVLVAVGVVEALDPSFKSERQVARYLDLPVLGTLPDARALLERIPD